jgi:hypothetical protein
MDTTTETLVEQPKRKRSISARTMARLSAKARMLSLTPEQRQAIARKAVNTRWARHRAAAAAAAEAQLTPQPRRRRRPAPAA